MLQQKEPETLAQTTLKKSKTIAMKPKNIKEKRDHEERKMMVEPHKVFRKMLLPNLIVLGKHERP